MNHIETALKYRCPHCYAEEGDWCVTKTGNRASDLHSARVSPIAQVASDGFREGLRDQHDIIERQFAILRGRLATEQRGPTLEDIEKIIERSERYAR